MVGSTRRSRTAQGVAAERAVLTDMGVLSDPFARGMLSPSMAVVFWVVRHWPYRVRARSLTLAGLAGRVLWGDAQLAEALDAGIRQVAIIGAGYDSRAWRFRRDGVQFFELDHPMTQRDKVRRAPGPGPTYVEADLTTQGVAQALRDGGLDPSQPALFMMEGVTMYLSEEVVRRQLGELARSGGSGSRLVVGFQPPPGAGTGRSQRQRRLQRLARVGSGETFKTRVDSPHAIALLQASGWQVDEATSLREAARSLVPHESGLPIDAVNEQKTLMACSRP